MPSFLAPSFFYLLALPLGAMLYFAFAPKRRHGPFSIPLSGPWEALKDQLKRTRVAFRWIFVGYLLVFSLLVLALARPVTTRTWVKKWTEGIDIVIVLDLSESMDAEDLTPTRLVAAKNVIRQFVTQRPNDRIGFVTFGGEAVMRSPLTRDLPFLLDQVEAVRLRELKQGTAIGMGIANGLSRLRRSESKNKVLILLTDGDSNVGSINPITASNLARQEGVKIYPIGIGKQDRVVIPIYSYDQDGRRMQLLAQVPSYLNPELLKKMAATTGGKAYMARDAGMLLQILQEIDQLEKTKVRMSPQTETEEWFFYPLALALLLALLVVTLEEFRYSRRQVPTHKEETASEIASVISFPVAEAV